MKNSLKGRVGICLISTVRRRIGFHPAKDKKMRRKFNTFLSLKQKSSRLPGRLFDISTLRLSRSRTVGCELECDVSIDVILTLISQYHVIITYFRTEFSWGDLKTRARIRGEIIFVNISILRRICPRQSFCHVCPENYIQKVVISLRDLSICGRHA